MLATIIASSFAGAHREAVCRILGAREEIPTDYDKPDEPASLDIPMAIEVTRPWRPAIFSKCVWSSAQGLLDYRDEILHGTHDHLADQLGYTYHDRFWGQMEGVMEELRRNPHTRRAQCITWRPETDLGHPFPPCFQRGWFRVRDGALDLHTHWRSRDMLKAWGSNVFGFAHLHKAKAEELDVPVGVYREFIDSAHIYGRDIETAKKMANRPLEEWDWPLSAIEEGEQP